MNEVTAKLQQVLNFSSSDGSVKTFFDGKITATQLAIGVIGFLVIFLVIRLCKSALLSLCLTIGLIVVGSSLFGVSMPSKLADSYAVIQDQKEKIEKISQLSENVKFDGSSASIKVGDNQWISTNDITSFIRVNDDTVSLSVAGNDIAICDKEVLELLEVFQK